MIVTSSPVRGLVDVTVTAPVPGDWVERAVCEVTILDTDFRVTEELVLGDCTGKEGAKSFILLGILENVGNIHYNGP